MTGESLAESRLAWERLAGAPAFRACLLWGAAFGLAEGAYFTRVNEMLPLGLGHVVLAAVLMVEYSLVAAIAPCVVRLLRRPLGSFAGPLAWLSGPWLLLLILVVSHYRDRMVLHARRKEDLLITAGLVAATVALGLVVAALLRNRSPRVPRRAANGLGLAAIAASAIWFASASSSWKEIDHSNAVTAEQAGPVDETGLRVLIVGMDGCEWSVLDPLLSAGKLPAYADLIARGRAAALKTIEPTYSPIIWTTIATGKSVEKHRILSHVYTQPPFGLPGIPHDPKRIKQLTKVMKANVRVGHRLGAFPIGIYASSNLKARQVWDIVGEFGLPVVCLEWYVTHPVRPVRGIEVSDRIHLMKGEGRAALSTAVWPDSLVDVLEPLIVTRDELPKERLEGFLDTEGLDDEGRKALRRDFAEWYRTLGGEMARDLSTSRMVPVTFPRVPGWRLGAVYYRAVDGSHHVTWRYRGLPAGDLGAHPERRFRAVVDRYAEFCDGLLRDTLALADEQTVVIVLSDHGWENQLWGHLRKPDGFFAMAGGPVSPSAERGETTIFDVAPTILALLGIPVPEDMDGRVLTEWIDPAFWASHPVRKAPSYEHPGALTTVRDSGGVDEEQLEQLRALGYVN